MAMMLSRTAAVAKVRRIYGRSQISWGLRPRCRNWGQARVQGRRSLLLLVASRRQQQTDARATHSAPRASLFCVREAVIELFGLERDLRPIVKDPCERPPCRCWTPFPPRRWCELDCPNDLWIGPREGGASSTRAKDRTGEIMSGDALWDEGQFANGLVRHAVRGEAAPIFRPPEPGLRDVTGLSWEARINPPSSSGPRRR